MRGTFVCMLLLVAFVASGKKHKHERGLPRTEVGLMNNVLGCLSNKDTANYFNLFPPFDTLWDLVMHNSNHSPDAVAQLNNLKEHPKALLEFDPTYNPVIMGRFVSILKKGEDSGIHWKEIVMQRYELVKETATSSALRGYDIIAPERFRGYVFVRDMLARLTFCISIAEIQKINGYFFGGQVINMLEANSIDEFHQKEAEEQRYFALLAEQEAAHADSLSRGLIDTAALDSAMAKTAAAASADQGDEDTFKKRREVVDRRYYEGKFDEEIPVKMFVRYMRDLRTGKINGYDGLYKFGDQVDYVKLNITRDADGLWIIDDDPPVGTMELELKGKIYTGSWTNGENQTGYDVLMTQTDIPSKKLEQLDKMLESGRLGSVEGETRPLQKSNEPVIEGMENNADPEPAKPADKEPRKKKKKARDDDDE